VGSENTGPVITGLVIGVAFVVMFSVVSNVGACGSPGLQISAPDLERQVRYSSFIVYGTVMSAELRPVDWRLGTGAGAELRYVVTISTDEYLLDETGEQRPTITFVERGFGCAYPFRSEIDADNDYAVEHRTGERALFFIEKDEGLEIGIEGDWNSFALFHKFAFVGEDREGNKLLQSKWYRLKGIEPVTEQKLEAEIKALISR